ncbi:MAG: hypothetical protein P8078_12805 [bacterium]
MIIKNNDERLIVIGDFRLLPGCNDVDQEEWENLFKPVKVDPNSKQKIKLFDIEKLPKGIEIISVIKSDKELFDFAELPEKERKNIINNTYNIKTLEKWIMEEPQNSLKYIMEKRIEGIKNNTITDVKTYGKPKNHV